MFLSNLNSIEKENFLHLVMICAKSDGVICKKEEEILEQYCDEMQIGLPQKTIKYDYIIDAFESDQNEYNNKVDEIMRHIEDSACKIVYFELML